MNDLQGWSFFMIIVALWMLIRVVDRADLPARIALMGAIVAFFIVIFSSGCSTILPPQPCYPAEMSFPSYTKGGIETVGKCETGHDDETGEDFTMCLVRTEKHGVIHKRMPTRACWELDSPYSPFH